jgi:hypothetical protein
MRYLILLLLCGPVAAQTAYWVQGTFDDGGTFSGTFIYNPTGIVALVGGGTALSDGAFGLSAQGGNSGLQSVGFAPAPNCPHCGGSAGGSLTAFHADYGVESENWTLVIDWNTPLTFAATETQQPIISGYEDYCFGIDPVPCPQLQRKIVSGSITPVTALATAVNSPPVDPLVAQLATAQAQIASLQAQIVVLQAAAAAKKAAQPAVAPAVTATVSATPATKSGGGGALEWGEIAFLAMVLFGRCFTDAKEGDSGD